MKKFKKAIVLIMSLCLVFSVAGCGNSGAKKDSADKVDIKKLLDEVATDLESSYNNYENLSTEIITDWSTYDMFAWKFNESIYHSEKNIHGS